MSRSDVELFALHLLGQLEGDEARAVAARAASPTPEDREALGAAHELLGTIARGAPPATPPAGARDRLLAAARATRREDSAGSPAPSDERPEDRSSLPPPSSSRAAPGSRRGARAAAIFAGALFLLLAALQVFQVLRAPSGGVAAEYAKVMLDPRTPRWLLREGGRPDGRPLASAFFDERRSMLLVGGDALPEIRPDEVYVLWALDKADAGRAPRNLAAFRTGGVLPHAVVAEAPTPGSLTALAISVETNPRVQSPTVTRIVAVGGS